MALYDLAAIEDLHFDLRVVLDLHEVAIGRIEENVQFVAVVGVTHMESGLRLFLNALFKAAFCEAGEISVQ